MKKKEGFQGYCGRKSGSVMGDVFLKIPVEPKTSTQDRRAFTGRHKAFISPTRKKKKKKKKSRPLRTGIWRPNERQSFIILLEHGWNGWMFTHYSSIYPSDSSVVTLKPGWMPCLEDSNPMLYSIRTIYIHSFIHSTTQSPRKRITPPPGSPAHMPCHQTNKNRRW